MSYVRSYDWAMFAARNVTVFLFISIFRIQIIAVKWAFDGGGDSNAQDNLAGN